MRVLALAWIGKDAHCEKGHEAVARDDSHRLRARRIPFCCVWETVVGVLAVLRSGLHLAAGAIMRRVLSVLFFALKGRYCGGAIQTGKVDDDFRRRNSGLPLYGCFLQLECIRFIANIRSRSI